MQLESTTMQDARDHGKMEVCHPHGDGGRNRGKASITLELHCGWIFVALHGVLVSPILILLNDHVVLQQTLTKYWLRVRARDQAQPGKMKQVSSAQPGKMNQVSFQRLHRFERPALFPECVTSPPSLNVVELELELWSRVLGFADAKPCGFGLSAHHQWWVSSKDEGRGLAAGRRGWILGFILEARARHEASARTTKEEFDGDWRIGSIHLPRAQICEVAVAMEVDLVITIARVRVSAQCSEEGESVPDELVYVFAVAFDWGRRCARGVFVLEMLSATWIAISRVHHGSQVATAGYGKGLFEAGWFMRFDLGDWRRMLGRQKWSCKIQEVQETFSLLALAWVGHGDIWEMVLELKVKFWERLEKLRQGQHDCNSITGSILLKALFQKKSPQLLVSGGGKFMGSRLFVRWFFCKRARLDFCSSTKTWTSLLTNWEAVGETMAGRLAISVKFFDRHQCWSDCHSLDSNLQGADVWEERSQECFHYWPRGQESYHCPPMFQRCWTNASSATRVWHKDFEVLARGDWWGLRSSEARMASDLHR